MPRFLIALAIIAIILAIIFIAGALKAAARADKRDEQLFDELTNRDSIPRAILAPPVFFAEQLQSHDRSNAR